MAKCFKTAAYFLLLYNFLAHFFPFILHVSSTPFYFLKNFFKDNVAHNICLKNN